MEVESRLFLRPGEPAIADSAVDALAAQHVMYNWIVPEHANNVDAAKEFLLHYTENYARAITRFGERGVFDLIAVNGFYSFVSMCLNVDRTPLPEGEPLPLKPL